MVEYFDHSIPALYIEERRGTFLSTYLCLNVSKMDVQETIHTHNKTLN